jgi:hypothetical protein
VNREADIKVERQTQRHADRYRIDKQTEKYIARESGHLTCARVFSSRAGKDTGSRQQTTDNRQQTVDIRDSFLLQGRKGHRQQTADSRQQTVDIRESLFLQGREGDLVWDQLEGALSHHTTNTVG